MSRLTQYNQGIAVLRNKEKHKEAMVKLARYEDAYRISIGPGVELVIDITEEILKDYKDCEAHANRCGAGKSCDGCSLNVDVFGSALCEYSEISKELLRRIN